MKIHKKALSSSAIIILCLTAITAFALNSCNKSEDDSNETKENWECVLDHFDVIITLAIYSTTDLVNVYKSPKKIGHNDQFHQFRDGDQYLLRNDTLYLKNLDGTVCYYPIDGFAITRLSEDTIKLQYLGGLWMGANYMCNYLFNRKK